MTTKYFCDECGRETEYREPTRSRSLSVSIGGHGIYGHSGLGCNDRTLIFCLDCEIGLMRNIVARLYTEMLDRIAMKEKGDAG